MIRGTSLGVVVVALLTVVAACSGPAPSTPAPAPTTSPTTAAAPTPVPAVARPALGSTPPPWLGTRVLPITATGYGEQRPTPRVLRRRAFTLPDQLPPLPGVGFAADVADPAPADVIARSTWTPGCPVAAADLAWVRLTFRGFDGARHTGELLVAGRVADDAVHVFRQLWRERFPIEQMHVTAAAELDLPPTGDGNNTSAFVCRAVRGTTSTFSQHAYGLAIDVDPFQNPYVRDMPAGRVVLPELATSYVDRGRVRPGMHAPGSPAVRAFQAVGWTWGGTFRALKDYQHFSLTGG